VQINIAENKLTCDAREWEKRLEITVWKAGSNVSPDSSGGTRQTIIPPKKLSECEPWYTKVDQLTISWCKCSQYIITL
jgi:hypothetical protein